MGDGKDSTDIWRKYQDGVDYHNRINLYMNTERAYNFYEGRQWAGLEDGGEKLPFYNFIRPTVDLKVASVAMNNMEIVYSPMNSGEAQEVLRDVCDRLNRYAERLWEHEKMTSKMWDMNRDAAVCGNSFLYFYDQSKSQLVDNTAIYFSDEQNPNIQEQAYVIIAERRPVEDIRKEARRNGCSDYEVGLILGDQEYQNITGVDVEVQTEHGKCLSLLYFARGKDGIVYFSKSTKNVVYKRPTPMGTTVYPIVGLTWGERKNSMRGIGDVTPMIPNQIEANKTLARRAIAVKSSAYPRMAYVRDKVDNPEALETVGSHIEISDTGANAINSIVSYLNPAPISGDAKLLTDELITTTRELQGASDAALGTINPEQASGAAIMAVRDQSMIPLNQQVQAFQQLIEDIARVWYALWVAYNPNGMEITYEQDGMMVSEIISAQWLLDMEISVKVDVSPANPYSKYAQEMSLQNLFQMGAITFDEYVEVLDDSAVMPKAKLERILEARRAKQEEQMQEMQMQEMQNMQAQEQVAEAETLGAQEAADIAELQSLIMA
jgi:hypothetical protein